MRAMPTVFAAESFPGISMTLPTNGATLSGVVLLSALADGTGIAGLQFIVNGGNLGSEISAGACSAEWNTTNGPDGTYILTALVRDELGNVTPTAPVVVNVTNAAPEISSVAAQNVTDSAAIITWNTGQTSTSQVEYGPTASYGSVSPMVEALVSNHAVSLSGLVPGTMYHFRVHSVNWLGVLSSSGDFILGTGGSSGAPGGCVTPDPFGSMGGGTCWNGGWLPPGIAPPGGNTVPAPIGWTLPQTPPATNHGICANADPFAGMGGGVCWGGGWLPPGMMPSVDVAPTTTLPSLGAQPNPLAPVAPPATGGGTCTTSDPFSALGSGTCWNGGWLPPGSTVPSGGNSSVNGGGSTSTVPAVAAPSGPRPCLGADPFTSMVGYRGTCVNGGWIPTRTGGN